MHRKWLCIPAALAFLFVQVAAARNIFLTPGDTTSSNVATFSSDPLTFGANLGGVPGGFTVLPSSNPSKYYAVTRSATDTVVVLEGRFPFLNATSRLAVMEQANAAAISPDARRLIIVGPRGVAVVDTTNDSIAVQPGSIDVGTAASDVAVSPDGTRAYVLSTDSRRLTAIDLSANRAAGSLQIATSPTAVSVGPNGVVYVSGQAAVYEIDGRTMALRTTIPVSGQPGKLQFTPDGNFALARNTNEFSGRGVFLIDLATRTVSEAGSVGVAVRDLAVVSNTQAYAVVGNGFLYVIAINAGGSLGWSQAAFTGTVPGALRNIAATPELTGARYLLLNIGTALYRLDIRANEVTSDYSATPFAGTMNMVSPANTGSASNILVYNATQTAAAGTTSLPLVIRAYDQSGLPVSGVPVTFSLASSGATLTATTTTTNFAGYATTAVTIPSSMTTGSVVVNASVASGARTQQFTVNIGDPGLNPGGGTGAPVRTGLQILQGQGEVLAAFLSTATQSPLQVKLTDASGNVVPNATVNWSLGENSSGSVNPQTSTTDSSGIATANFTASQLINPGLDYQVNRIIASTDAPVASSVDFYVVTVLPPISGSFSAQRVLPLTTNIQAKAGQVLQSAIQFQVSAQTNSTPLPFVGLRVVPVNADPSFSPTAGCVGGSALSNQQGVVNCDLAVGPRVGTITLRAIVGERFSYDFNLEVLPGDPAKLLNFTQQAVSVNPGAQVPVLQVQVTDAGGTAIANVPVSWDIPSTFSGVTAQTPTDASGYATARMTAPAAPGLYNVSVRAAGLSFTFSVTVNANVGQMVVIGGNNQTAGVGQPFAQPVTVRVLDTQGNRVQGAVVNFQVSGPATASGTSATTNANGEASVTVTAGSTTGLVSIVVSSGSAGTTFTLNVVPPGPAFTANDVLDAAGYQPGVSPGSLAYIRVRGIAPTLTGSVSAPQGAPLPTTLRDVQVSFNEIPAPILAVSNVNGQESVIVQVPFEVQPGQTTVTVRAATGDPASVTTQILPYKPGVFTVRDANGSIYVNAVRSDGTYVSSTNPARRGETITVFATGLGQTAPATGTNRIAQAGQLVTAPIIAGVNNAGIRVVSAQLYPGSIGTYMVTVEIPADAAPGANAPFGFAVIGADGQPVFANGTALPIQ